MKPSGTPGTIGTHRSLLKDYAMNSGPTNSGEESGAPAAVRIAPSPGLYVHIPFCTVRCSYCDFHVASWREAIVHRYVDALLAELRLLEAEGFRPKTIFIGGGTPSTLPTSRWEELLGALADAFGGGLIEWTIEANPGTIDEEKARIARRWGVDRISTGAQTFDPAGLKVLGRDHGRETVAAAHALLREAGFQRQSLDLIVGWPGQTIASIEGDLEQVAAIDPDHISLYHLSYESGTALERRREHGRIVPLADDQVLSLARRALGGLRDAGYTRYEVSNLCRPGQESLHNLNYWQRGEYRGIGSGAASFDGARRWKNLPDVGAYLRAEGTPERVDEESVEGTSILEELIFLSLRLSSGLDLAEFERVAGRPLEEVCPHSLPELTDAGYLERGETHLRATERGFEVLDTVIVRLWEDCQ